jgi:hypothetical protein
LIGGIHLSHYLVGLGTDAGAPRYRRNSVVAGGVYLAAQNGIDLLDQLPHGLRVLVSENQLELALRRIQRHRSRPPSADATELKAQNFEALSLL